MTIVEEILRLATLAQNYSSALRMTVMVMFWMVVEVLAWGAVVAAGRFVVAAADGFVEWVAVRINVEGKAAGTAAGWAGVTGGWACVSLEVVVVFHGFSVCCPGCPSCPASCEAGTVGHSGTVVIWAWIRRHTFDLLSPRRDAISRTDLP